MTETKEEATLLAQSDPKEKTLENIVAVFSDAVKRNDLRTILAAADIQPREAVKLLRQYFPSFDKTMLSKCCKPYKYGCVLHPDGYAAIRLLLGVPDKSDDAAQETSPEPARRRCSSGHRFTCRVAGRLPDDKFLRLQRYIRMEGWETTQDWVTAQVDAYIKEMEVKYGDNP